MLENRFSIQGTALGWFTSYLSDRTQSFVNAGDQTVVYRVDCSVPRGPVLEPVEFIAYVADATDVDEKHNIHAHLYADDIQMHNSCRPDIVSDARRRVSDCTADFITYTASRRLQHNTDKTEAMWVGSKCSLRSLVGQYTPLIVGTETIHPVTVLRDL